MKPGVMEKVTSNKLCGNHNSFNDWTMFNVDGKDLHAGKPMPMWQFIVKRQVATDPAGNRDKTVNIPWHTSKPGQQQTKCSLDSFTPPGPGFTDHMI